MTNTDMSLRDAAQAVIDRWETPLWKDAPATAVFIADLRDALARDAGRASLQFPGFTAADMATASAQGFRDGVASISANAESEPVYQARYQKGFWQDSSRERCEYLQNPENTCAEDWETRILYTRPPTSAEGVEHG